MKPGNASHVLEIGGHKCGITGEGVRRNGDVEILDPSPTSFQHCLDATIRVTDGIGPLGSWKF